MKRSASNIITKLNRIDGTKITSTVAIESPILKSECGVSIMESTVDMKFTVLKDHYVVTVTTNTGRLEEVELKIKKSWLTKVIKFYLSLTELIKDSKKAIKITKR